ncbi:hypothetical protein [Marinomonas mediterranea]|uniref:hypothetical protein n=1 Tax=Marinomonas mediterranea TaxID=119864 RepID=UPI0023492201|nr:hypothetical protein [Marinomonas mediterranea]WCN09668.1 hypothetical protein GV055_12470 [Marinomonas mediterranea]
MKLNRFSSNIGVIACFSLACTSSIADTYKHLAVNRYYQDDACWCSVANIEMISDWIANEYSSRFSEQKKIAERYGIGEWNGASCVKDNGVIANGLGLHDVSSSLNYEIKNIKGISGYEFSEYLAASSSLPTLIASNVYDGNPVILLSYTVYKTSKPKRNMGHYFTIDAIYSSVSEAEFSSSDVEYFYVNDPAYGSPHTVNVDSISPRTAVSKYTLLNKYAADVSGKHAFITNKYAN